MKEKVENIINTLVFLGVDYTSWLNSIIKVKKYIYVRKWGTTHGDVKYCDHVESRGEDGAHAFDWRLIQAVVGRQHLPERRAGQNNKLDMQLDTKPLLCVVWATNPSTGALTVSLLSQEVKTCRPTDVQKIELFIFLSWQLTKWQSST